MRWFIATLLASAIQIVTAEDTQYTIKAAGIKAKVSCCAKYYMRLSTWQLVKYCFSLSPTARRSPTCGLRTSGATMSTSFLVTMT